MGHYLSEISQKYTTKECKKCGLTWESGDYTPTYHRREDCLQHQIDTLQERCDELAGRLLALEKPRAKPGGAYDAGKRRGKK